MILRGIGTSILALLVFLTCAQSRLQAQQKFDKSSLQQAHLMLKQARDEIKKNYYDTTYHGVDLDKVYQQFDARLDQSKSVNETFRVIAAFMLSFHDSHLFFMPPMRTNPSTFGYAAEVIGDKCIVIRTRPGTDAATKLHVGDEILALNGIKLAPENFHDIEYLIQGLSPAPSEMFDLKSPTGEQRQETVNAKLRMGKQVTDETGGGEGGDYWQRAREEEEDEHLARMRYEDKGDTFILRIPTFEIDKTVADKAIEKAMKSKHLIIDLRDNGGGSEDTLKNLLGHFFDHEVKLGDLVTRKESKAETIKPRKPFYNGDVIVLVDHNSASASELFARVIQLERRGKVMGDHSAGAVMQAQEINEALGSDYKIYYGLSITSANILMTDGKSLEKVGVTPDEILVPTGADLAAGKDPVLSHAADVAGLKLDPITAGKMFPFEWPTL
jgi:C-terminal processing protease CtpA/Prc